jgi:hypothetical protein
MNPHDTEIRKAREMLAQMEHCFSYFKSFIEKQHQFLNSLCESQTDATSTTTTTNETEMPGMFDNKKLATYLGVSTKTLKRYRDEGLIPFKQAYGKFWYSPNDVTEFFSKIDRS